jgi:hypothetical protein
MYDRAIQERLDREVATFLDEEYAVQGENLYQWYRNRFLAANNTFLTSSIGLAPYDKAIARFVIERCPFAKRFVEIGAGVGQQSIFLAMMRMPSCAVEANTTNLDMMKRLVARIAERLDPELPKYMTPIYDWYPTLAAEYVDAETILSFPTLSWGLDAGQELTLFDSLRAAGGVILSLSHFFRLREEPAQHEELIAQIRDRGFDGPVEIQEWKQWHEGFHPDRLVFMKKSATRGLVSGQAKVSQTSQAETAVPSATTAAESINAVLLQLHQERVVLGVDQSGLYAHYKLLLDSGQIAGQAAAELADLIANSLPPFDSYHVLRAGLGELAFVLAALGLRAVGFDQNSRRFAAMSAGLEKLCDGDPQLARRLMIGRVAIPDVPKHNRVLGVATYLIGYTPGQEDQALAELSAYSALLIRPEAFLRSRNSDEVQEVLVEAVRARGFTQIREFPKLGVVYCAKPLS